MVVTKTNVLKMWICRAYGARYTRSVVLHQWHIFRENFGYRVMACGTHVQRAVDAFGGIKVPVDRHLAQGNEERDIKAEKRGLKRKFKSRGSVASTSFSL